MTTIGGDEFEAVTIDGDEVEQITVDGDVVWEAIQPVDTFAHGSLTDYYQGATGDHTLSTAWTTSGTYSLNGSDGAGIMRSFPQSNSYSSTPNSLEYYPQRGDTIEITARVRDDQDDGYNSTGDAWTFIFNGESRSGRFEYTHHISLEGAYHELEDNYTDDVTSRDTNETYNSGDILLYELQWNTDDTVTCTIYRNETALPGSFTMNVSSPGTDPGIGWRLRSDGDGILIGDVSVR